MRRMITGLLAAALSLGLLAAAPAEAKVYKMKPEERAAALQEKKDRKAKKKAGKAVGDAPGGWVEVKPGEKPARKAKKSAKVDEIAKAAEKKGQKGKKAAEAGAKPAGKAAEKKPAADKKADKRTKKAVKGDRLVTKSYSGETKVQGASAEVRRPEGAAAPAAQASKADDLSAYSVSRPGQDKAPAVSSGAPAVAPEVRQEVQPGPPDAAKPVGTERKGGEGRF